MNHKTKDAMGIIHYAYYLDTDAFRAIVPDDAKRGGTMTIESLRAEAAHAPETCSEVGRDFLDAICFDQDWLEVSPPDVYRTEELVKVWITRHIRDYHKLSLTSFAILERVLPVLGWPEQRMRLLLVGRRFIQLPQKLGFSKLLRDNPFPDTTAWLGTADAQMLIGHLSEIGDQFLRPTESVLTAATIAGLSAPQESSGSLLARSFNEARERLELAVRNGYDILLVNDVGTHKLDKIHRLEPL